MLTLVFLFAVPVLLMTVLFHVMPALTRPGLFFAVTVQPEFRRTPEGRRIVRRFHIFLWSCALIAVVLELTTGLALAAMLIQMAGCLGSFISAHAQARAYAVAPDAVVEVDLAAPPERLPGGPVAAFLPFAFIAAVGAWAALHWDSLPPRFPVHWGFRGADRWVATTPSTVFGFLAVQASLCLMLLGIAWGVLNWSRRISTAGPSATSERLFRHRILLWLIAAEYLLAAPACFAVFEPASKFLDIWLAAIAIGVMAILVTLLRAGQGGSRTSTATEGAPIGDRTPDACWKWGLIYVNPADPSLLVEKRFGVGYTVNLGNRRALLLLALLLIPATIALIFLR
ncbi:MAG TPA: DUF5808 domain-containing protein [Bryobacteraceae bacterium]|nr:DUF5808 domain-containing protein [Bryobacteraceae bacterium]